MDVIWPDRPTCHDKDWQAARFGQQIWRKPAGRRLNQTWDAEKNAWQERTDWPASGYDEQYRTCSYCGSIHPEDLYHYLSEIPSVRLGGSDWKYGYPHKFYVEGIPNPAAGQESCNGNSSGPIYADDGTTIIGRYHEPHIGPAPSRVHAKWYNLHFLDLTDEAFDLLAPLVSTQSGIIWYRKILEDGSRDIFYSSPYHGYQAGY